MLCTRELPRDYEQIFQQKLQARREWHDITQSAERKKLPPRMLHSGDFPGGAVVKNPPANAGNMGLSPGPGRSHILRSN